MAQKCAIDTIGTFIWPSYVICHFYSRRKALRAFNKKWSARHSSLSATHLIQTRFLNRIFIVQIVVIQWIICAFHTRYWIICFIDFEGLRLHFDSCWFQICDKNIIDIYVNSKEKLFKLLTESPKCFYNSFLQTAQRKRII